MAKPKKQKKVKQLIRIPSRIYIKGKEWQVGYKWNLRLDGVKVDGYCDSATRTIYLDKALDPMEKKLTVMHELAHAIFFEAHLGEAGGLEGFNEKVAAAAIADFFGYEADVKFRKPSCRI